MDAMTGLFSGTYEWRGVTPLTRWTPSRWKVAAQDPAGAWLVNLFVRTPVTPAGLDICTRMSHLLPDTERQILRELERRPEMAGLLPGVFAPRQTW